MVVIRHEIQRKLVKCDLKHRLSSFQRPDVEVLITTKKENVLLVLGRAHLDWLTHERPYCLAFVVLTVENIQFTSLSVSNGK